MYILFGILSILVLIGIAFLMSENKKAIKWRTVASALAIQLVLMVFVLKAPLGQKILQVVADAVVTVLSFGNEGLAFVFGDLSSSTFIFAINVLGLICFTSALISVLYYLKIIPYLVKYLGKAIAKVLGTTEVETFCSVGNSFLGTTEAPLLTKPFLPELTRSELFAVVTGGFASVSVSVIGGYALMGIEMKYLLMAMSTVPFATLLMSKIIIPETETSRTADIDIEGSEASNLFEAIGDGAIQGLQLALNVGAVLIAFLGLIALLNYFLGFLGLSFSEILGVVFRPLAWLFGIPAHETGAFATLIGTKIAMNEFVAFTELGEMMQSLSPRTQAILSVALCNFANFSSIGIAVAGFKAFAPSRSLEVSGFGIKALVGGTLTTLITASIVGMFF
ncbi:MAG: NupC/NupG family nucleoside CNT transporter [Cellulosilyticaceae bacterium]